MVDPGTAMAALRVAQDVGGQLLEVIERERTNRAGIAAKAAVLVEQVRARRDILAEAVREQAETRRLALSRLADSIDAAARQHDVETLRLLIGAFVKITLEDPLDSIIDMDRRLREGTYVLQLGAPET